MPLSRSVLVSRRRTSTISKAFLYISGVGGVLVILVQVVRAFIKRRRVYAAIVTKTD
jgi:hypothetical protein